MGKPKNGWVNPIDEVRTSLLGFRPHLHDLIHHCIKMNWITRYTEESINRIVELILRVLQFICDISFQFRGNSRLYYVYDSVHGKTR